MMVDPEFSKGLLHYFSASIRVPYHPNARVAARDTEIERDHVSLTVETQTLRDCYQPHAHRQAGKPH
jgi:hypothetical protein